MADLNMERGVGKEVRCRFGKWVVRENWPWQVCGAAMAMQELGCSVIVVALLILPCNQAMRNIGAAASMPSGVNLLAVRGTLRRGACSVRRVLLIAESLKPQTPPFLSRAAFLLFLFFVFSLSCISFSFSLTKLTNYNRNVLQPLL